ncbi:MAG: dephospho-CoA kinase [Tissierellia bacterium]|nr:dephospho-CoA kinase [Tissierellia bacterium]
MKHTNCKIIGITGGISTGKSTASKIIQKKGFAVIDADLIAREVVEVGKPAYKELIKYFGEGILREDGSIDRKKLGDTVFNDVRLLNKLNSILHPYIYEEMKLEMEKYCGRDGLVFLDIPLLYEKYHELNDNGIIFDEVWLVYADEEVQLKRLMERNNLNKEEAMARIRAQLPLEEKKRIATRLIDNNKDINYLKKQVEELLRGLS